MDLLEQLNLLTDTVIKTLDQNKEFKILLVTQSEVLIKVYATGKVRNISIQCLRDAYSDLQKNRELTRIDIEKKYSPRNPAYVAALLSKLQGVTHRVKPITLQYHD